MSELTDLRTRLSGARRERDDASHQLAIARARLAEIDRQLATANRAGAREQTARLTKERGALAERVAAGEKTHATLKATAGGLLGRLGELADPTKQIAELSDRTPILMMPLRLETRFHGEELWIRVYPDDCSIDAFEPLLSDSEVTSVAAFWVATWRAGGVEAQERGAWRTLVGASGAGRAAYAITQLAPTDPTRPHKDAPDDVLLVIVPRITVTDDERARAFAYWEAVWAANGDAEEIAAARSDLASLPIGAARADELIAGFAPDPAGWDPPVPKTRADVAVSCAICPLPAPPAATKTSWTRAPIAVGLPDRFVALLWGGGAAREPVIGNPIPDGLATAPDPSLGVGDQIQITDDDLVLNPDLAWVADFEQAVAVGMGFRIRLTAPEARRGFDRLIVVGVRMSTDERESAELLGGLVDHQRTSKAGFGLVPQGSPTNNTDSATTAHSWVDDPDASFDILFHGATAYTETTDPLARRDGEWLAEALAIDGAVVKQLAHAAGTDQAEARAMNIALWNGTLGYMLSDQMSPVFSPADIAATREYFTQFVSGRGPLPAVRIGKQPYGVLPVLAFARYRAGDDRIRIAALPSYLQRLHDLLARIDADWTALAANVARVGGPGDPHQVLLDVVGLHSGSVEYHQRYAESLDQLYNTLTMEGGWLLGALVAAFLAEAGKKQLEKLGADPDAHPAILEKFFYGKSPLLDGPVVDDVPLSETKPIREYTADHANYIEWLARSSLDAIRRQDFGGGDAPRALLYLMLRHAMMLSRWDAGLRLLETRGIPTERFEPSFIHVQAAVGHSKLAPLVVPQPAITGDATMLLADYVMLPAVLAVAPETEALRDVIAALGVLAHVPTARLERVFAEHVDTVTYRLDAWKSGLAAARLAEVRAAVKEPGLYLGAYGWLEDVRPKTKAPTPVELDPERAQVFARRTDAPLVHDPDNAGYIHAPSLNQAAAAAILKNAYRVNATPANPDAMAVNLSSRRVREALAVLEGIRNGQTLSALLGYRFERGLHDDHGLAEVDKFIYPLRAVFPLVANKLKETHEVADIKLLEARNVIDGNKLVDRARGGQRSYPFGFPTGDAAGQLPAATVAERDAIDAEVDRLLDVADALADLVMAESVYQVVQGNFDRAAANQQALLDGGHPPEIEVVKTPRSGLSLEHRVALHLDPAAAPGAPTPRAAADAPLASWLADRMPAAADIAVLVTYATPVTPETTVTVTLAQLGLHPIDLVYAGDLDLDQAMADLDDRIVQRMRYSADGHPDMAVTIRYTEPVPGAVSLFEAAALVRSLRAVMLHGRTLRPVDMVLPLEGDTVEATWSTDELALRVDAARAALADRRDALLALEADASDLDDYAELVSGELLRTGLHGVPNAGTGHIHGDIRAIYDAVAAKLKAVVVRWTARQADYDALLATWPALATDDAKIAMLVRAELLVVTTATATPPGAAAYRTIVEAARGAFDSDLAAIAALLAWDGTGVIGFATAADAMTPVIAARDNTPFSIADQLAAITRARDALAARVTSVRTDLDARITAVALALADASQDGEDRIAQLTGAAKQVLGDEIRLIPRFRLPVDRAAEVAACVAASPDLLTDLRATRRFPVDDWLHGVARVRPKLAAWENVVVLGDALRGAVTDLVPLQLPFVAGDRWTALEFDAEAAAPNNRLVYTAHFATPFAPAAEQCGLVVDEWPELVPVNDVVSGVTFHFDRPSSQPPQVMLLAVPPVVRGHWTWDDLVATLVETLDGAKQRAVEPAQVDSTQYAQLVPATVTAVTLYALTIATNLAQNIRIFEQLGGTP